MTERHTGGREPAPQESIFEEELRGFKRARLEGHISSEQLQRIKETLAAPDLKKLQKLRLTRDITGEDFIRLKNIFESKEPTKKGGAGAAEAARVSVVPETIATRPADAGWEAERRAAEIKPEERAAIFNIFKEATRGWDVKISKDDISEFVRQLSAKKLFGTTILEMASGAGVGFLARSIATNASILTGGTGYLVSVPAGAVAGALAGGVTAWLRERHREVSQDEIVEKARETGGDLKIRIERYLELTGTETQSLKEERNNLYQEFRKEFGTRKKQIIIGAAKGAFFGAVGGTVATWIFDQFGTSGGGKTAENLAEARKAANAAGGEALRQQMEAAAATAQVTESGRMIKAGLAGLDMREFTAVARKGEGATNLARKLISDYINQHQALGDKKFSFNKAQLVYAEDWLQKEIFKGTKPHLEDVFKTKGEMMAKALAGAAGLSTEEIENLNKKWVVNISEKTWKSIFDFKNVYSAKNDFATGIFEEAKRKSAETARKAAEELGRAAARPPSPVATEAAESWLRASGVKWGLGAIGVGVAAGAAYRYRETIASGAGKAGRALAHGAGRAHELMSTEVDLLHPFRKIAEGGTSVRRMAGALRRQAEEQEAAGPLVDAERQREAEEQPSPVVDVERRREVEETAQRNEAARLEAQRTETERVEHEKKLAADPVRKLFQEFGQAIEPRDGLTYKALPKEAIDAGQGRAITFDNYPDFCEHSRGLTPEQKAEAAKWKTTFDEGTKDEKKYPTVGVWASKSFWDKLKANPELERRFDEMSLKIKGGLLADEYRGLPEKEDPKKVIGPLIEELEAKFKGTVFYFHRNYNYNRGFSLEEEVEGLQKLSRVLEGIREELSSYRSFVFKIGKKGVSLDGAGICVIEVDPALSEEEMREYILGAQPKVTELTNLRRESYALRDAIAKEHGFFFLNASYDKISVEREIASLKTLQEALRDFPVGTLKLTADTKPTLEIGPTGVRKSLSGDVSIYIPPDLSAEETRRYLASAADEVELLRSAEQK